MITKILVIILAMQIVVTPRIETINVHNAVARVRMKAIGEVIEKLESKSVSCHGSDFGVWLQGATSRKLSSAADS